MATEPIGKFAGNTKFFREIFKVSKSLSVEDTLDQLELLVDMSVEFQYSKIYLYGADGEMEAVREFCPEELVPDWAYIQWAIDNQEMTVIPDESPESNCESVLILPLVGNEGVVGLIALWCERNPSEFTQGDFSVLKMIAHAIASRLEAHDFHEKLKESQDRLLAVVETVPHGLLSIDDDRTINLVNGTMQVMLGIRRDNVVSSPYSEVLPSEICQLLDTHIDNKNWDEAEITAKISRQDSFLGLTVTPMSVGGGYVVLCRDLSMSRELTKLREVDAIKNDFISLVSHELRTPLTSILAYTEALMMDGMVDTEEEKLEYLEIIYNEGERLTRLINDVLDLTKMEAGKLEYVYEKADINSVVGSSIANSLASSEQKGHELISDLAADLPQLLCDPDRLIQVMMNFLSNAIKYSPDNSKITVRTSLVDHEGQKAIKVEVIDTGVGIAPENIDKVFSRFEQIESMDHHTTGTGLGMPICKMIIEQGHGGVIDLESTIGVGSKFFFIVPLL